MRLDQMSLDSAGSSIILNIVTSIDRNAHTPNCHMFNNCSNRRNNQNVKKKTPTIQQFTNET